MKECLKAQSCLLPEDDSEKSVVITRPVNVKKHKTAAKKKDENLESKASHAPSESSLSESKLQSSLNVSQSVTSDLQSSKMSGGQNVKKDKEKKEDEEKVE